MKENIFFSIATHKNYTFPDCSNYIPIHVGKEISTLDTELRGDNSGDNISYLNHYFCELTAVYWMWKNINSHYYGLSHYRRYFRALTKPIIINGKEIADPNELVKSLATYEIVISKPRFYGIETIKSHYKNAHYASDLDRAESAIKNLCPEYLESFHKVMNGRKLSLYNMFLMKKEHFHSYCEWIFPILFKLKEEIPYLQYGPYQSRVFGFLSERLLNVWVIKNIPKEKVFYSPIVNLEGENLIKKAVGLINRKITGVKLK